MSSASTLERSGSLRLFLALRVPEPALDRIVDWSSRELLGAAPAGARVVPREQLHVTLAFLGARPAGELPAVVEALRAEALRTSPFPLEPERYRETRSVGMIVLRDASGAAAGLASRLHERLERLGVYRREARPWLPHLTVLRFRERPRLRPATVPPGAFVPSDAAAFLSRLHPSGARYEVLATAPLGEAGAGTPGEGVRRGT